MPSTPSEVVAYVRVSSRAQDVATQRASIERAAASRGDTIADWYSEKRTAKFLTRPELQRLRSAAHRGEVRRLYVYKLDRLCRSGIRDMFEVVEELHAAGVHLVPVADPLDFSSPLTARIALAVLAICAEMERENIANRTAEARARVEAEGGHWGRPPRLEGAQLERARELRAAGRTIRQIAQGLGVPKSCVQRALASKTPAGARRPENPQDDGAPASLDS